MQYQFGLSKKNIVYIFGIILLCCSVYALIIEFHILTADKNSVGCLLDSNKIKLNIWYCVDLNLDSEERIKDSKNKNNPLKYGRKATIINPGYLEEEGYYSPPWNAFMFKEIQTTKGTDIVIDKKISIIHGGGRIEQDQIDSSILNYISKEVFNKTREGIYYFKKNGTSIVEVMPKDLAFIKSYYRVYIQRSDGKLNPDIFFVKTEIVSFEEFEYFPSGRVSKKTMVTMQGNQKGYGVIEFLFDDVDYGLFSDRQYNKRTRTVIFDKNSPYWLNNMLHD